MTKTRETWPDCYKEPHWLWSLKANIPTVPSSKWVLIWTGAFWAFFILIMIFASIDEDGPIVHGSNSSILKISIIGALASATGFLMTYKSSGTSHEEIFHRFLKEKALADSYSKTWSENELSEMTENWQWSVNYAENSADKIKEKREANWVLRRFYKGDTGGIKRPTPFIHPDIQYLGMLIQEVKQRIYKARREAELTTAQAAAAAKEAAEQAERENLGDEVWAARTQAIESVDWILDNEFWDWRDTLSPLRMAAKNAIQQATSAAQVVPAAERLTVWKKTWSLKWQMATAAARKVVNRNEALVRVYDAGRKLEIKYVGEGPEDMTEIERERWQRIEEEHDQLVASRRAEVEEAEGALKRLCAG